MKEKEIERCFICGAELIPKGKKTDREGRVSEHKECPVCGNIEHWYDAR
ncbi:MAG: hypothetical protein ACI4CT_01035 [Lachnospiraceae bacterium]